ncbi:MAG: Ig-like domain-containing protein [Verrucomicrobiota bacterium]
MRELIMRNMRILLSILVLLLIPTFVQALTAQERGNYPLFDTRTDLLLAQYDSLPDPDDIHAQAALGSMLLHPDLKNVDVYAVLGATGIQGYSDGFIDSRPLMEKIYGREGKNTWTYAWDGHLVRGVNWNRSVDRVKNKVRSVIENGGVVFVAEAGQSNITAAWIRKLIDEGVSPSLIKSNVVVVQHSRWNENQSSPSDLGYVQDQTSYIKIDDGNLDYDEKGKNGKKGKRSPAYNSSDLTYIQEALSPANENESAKDLWGLAEEVIVDSGWPGAPYSTIPGGADFSDTVEVWWIMEINTKADTIRKFWDRYVVEGTSSGIGDPDPPIITSYYEGSEDGVVVMDIEFDSPNNLWSEERSIASYTGNSYYVATADSFQQPGFGTLNYPFVVTKDGNYQFQWRSYITIGDNNTEHNDNWARLIEADGKTVDPANKRDLDPKDDWYKIYMNTIGKWTWQARNVDNNAQPVHWDLVTGKQYVLQVSARSRGHAIDRLLLWDRNSNKDYASRSTGNTSQKQNNQADKLPVSKIIEDNSANNPPSVAFEDSSTLRLDEGYTSIKIDASASDSDGSIKNVALYINNVLIRSDKKSPYTWFENKDPGLFGLQAGTYELKAIATDNEGATAEAVATLTVTQTVTNTPPTVSFNPSSELNKIEGYEGIYIEADAADPDGKIANVELYLEEVFIGSDNRPKYNWFGQKNPDLFGLQAGTYELKAIATDNEGATAEAVATLTVTQTVINTPPTVSFNPSSELNKIEGYEGILIEADAADPDGKIANVELYVNDVFFSYDNIAPYAWFGKKDPGLLALDAGSYVLKLVATDNEGAVAEATATLIVETTEEQPVIYEAEGPEAITSGPFRNDATGFSGTGYIKISGRGFIEWTVEASEDLKAETSFGYSLASGNRPFKVIVNSIEVNSDLSFPATGGRNTWSETASLTLDLLSGSNSIRIENTGLGGANIDYLRITALAATEPIITLEDDAYIENGKAKNDNSLRLENSDRTRVSYLKFNISGLSGPPTSAILELEVMDSGNGTIRAFLGDYNSWSEENLAGLESSPPMAVSEITSISGPVSIASIIALDLTSAISGDGDITIILAQDPISSSRDDIWFSSKEGSSLGTLAPKLTIVE